VAQLPEAMRSALLLRYFENMSYAQIAEITHCNETTARTRVARAKKILSQDLQDIRHVG
jgi:RNA polymerase sigma factor (sigma-70 family)